MTEEERRESVVVRDRTTERRMAKGELKEQQRTHMPERISALERLRASMFMSAHIMCVIV